MESDKMEITNTKAKFFAGPRDSPIPINVFEVYGGPSKASVFIYRCPLNLDLDGAPTTYGLDNPGGENSARDKTLQLNLKPLESRPNQISGLGNACGDPNDGSNTKGFNNFLFVHDRNFYWAGLTAVTKAEGAARGLVYDTRAFLEAGRKDAKSPIAPKGEGYFPVIQSKDNAPAKGYYVSATATRANDSLPESDPNRFVNAEQVPYAVWANLWGSVTSHSHTQVAVGDFGLAIDPVSGVSSGFLFGDSGTPNKVGECSSALYNLFPHSKSPTPVIFMAFPGSGYGPIVGPNAQNVIKAMVVPQMIRLAAASNASELVERIAQGLPAELPKPTTPPPSPKNPTLALALAAKAIQKNIAYLTTLRLLMQWGFSPS